MLTEESARLFVERTFHPETIITSAVRRHIGEKGLEHEEIRASQLAFFRTLCLAAGVREMLELGTFIGYSAIGIAEAFNKCCIDGHITSIEQDLERSESARELIVKSGLDDYITLIVGNDREVCQALLA